MLAGDENSRLTAEAVKWRELLSGHIRQYGALFYRIAFGVLRDRASAEDVCQTAYLRACERPPVDAAALKGWLVTTIINSGLELLRRRKLERRVLGDHARMQASLSGPSEPTSELNEIVLVAVEKLGEVQKTVVMLRLFEGLSGNQTSEILGCSAGEVSRQLHRGMDQMRALLGADLSRFR